MLTSAVFRFRKRSWYGPGRGLSSLFFLNRITTEISVRPHLKLFNTKSRYVSHSSSSFQVTTDAPYRFSVLLSRSNGESGAMVNRICYVGMRFTFQVIQFAVPPASATVTPAAVTFARAPGRAHRITIDYKAKKAGEVLYKRATMSPYEDGEPKFSLKD
jgi:hypothetical protein